MHSLANTRFPSWRQIRHLPEVLSSNDNLRLQVGSVLVLFGLAVFGARFYYSHTQLVPAVGGTMTEGIVGTPRSLNPILAISNDVDSDLVRLTYSSLFAADGNGALTPDLVDGYTVSPDQKIYTLRLLPAKWHDGKPVTADDVVFTFSLLQDPNWKSPLQTEFIDVAAQKIDDGTVRFTLKSPFAPFLSELTFGIVPEHVWKDVSPQDVLQAEANLKPVGSGPFEYSDLKRDGRGFVLSYDLKRNPGYYRQTAFLEGLSFRFYPDATAALDALKRQEVDSLSYVPRDLRTNLSSISQTVAVSMELPQYMAVFFNQSRNVALKDKAVRQALALATNTSRIMLDVLHGEGHPIDGPPLPVSSATGTIAFNPDSAGTLLDAAGWKIDKADGIRKKTTTVATKTKTGTVNTQSAVPLHITLTAVDQPESLATAKIIKDSWVAIGVAVDLNAVAVADASRTVVKPRDYEALLYSQLLGPYSDPYLFWHSSQANDQGQNLALFVNRQADDAIEAARATTDPSVRQTQYGRFLTVLANEVPAVFLYSPSYVYPLPANLKGFTGTRTSAPSDRFATVTGWYLKTQRAWK